MYRNMLISVSCDWPTVKNVVTGNSSSKPDRTGRDENLSNSQKCLITLHIVGWVIISNDVMSSLSDIRYVLFFVLF